LGGKSDSGECRLKEEVWTGHAVGRPQKKKILEHPVRQKPERETRAKRGGGGKGWRRPTSSLMEKVRNASYAVAKGGGS